MKKVEPSLYSRDYFEFHCRGQDCLPNLAAGELHPIFQRALQSAGLSGSEHILDYGCGRGELLYACVQKGCSAIGIDVSEAAIQMCRETLSGLPDHLHKRIDLRACPVEDIHLLDHEFDVIFMIDVFEHLYDPELALLMPKFRRALKPEGRLVIQTPNLLYENVLYPAKRILEFPFTLLKETGRLIRRTGKRKSMKDFFTKVFKFQFHDDPIYKKLHINVQTPWSLKRRLEKYGFQNQIVCVDPSRNLLSLLFGRWAGRTIDVLSSPR